MSSRCMRRAAALTANSSRPHFFQKFTAKTSSAKTSSSPPVIRLCKTNPDISKYKDWLQPDQVLKIFTQLRNPDAIFSLFYQVSSRRDYLPSEPLYSFLLQTLSASPSSIPQHLQPLLLQIYHDQQQSGRSWHRRPLSDHFFFNLIALHASHSPARAASILLDMHRLFGCSPSIATFNLALGITVSTRLLDLAGGIFRAAPSLGVHADARSIDILARGLCGEGEVDAALRLVGEFPLQGCYPEVATVSALVRGLCKEGRGGEAAEVAGRWGVEPDAEALHMLLRVVSEEGEAKAGVIERLVGAMGRETSAATYGEVVGGLVMEDRFVEARRVMEKMMKWGVNPSCSVFKKVAKGLAGMGLWEDVYWVLGQMFYRGYGPGITVWAYLLANLSLTFTSPSLENILA